MIEILAQNRHDMLDPEKKKEMMEGIVTEIMARMKEQGMSQDDILATIEKISRQGIEEEEEWPTKKRLHALNPCTSKEKAFLKTKKKPQKS